MPANIKPLIAQSHGDSKGSMEGLREGLRGVAQQLAKTIEQGSVLGLGSGSTVATLLEELSPILIAKSKKVTGVPTSTQIELVAARSGIPLVPFRGSVD